MRRPSVTRARLPPAVSRARRYLFLGAEGYALTSIQAALRLCVAMDDLTPLPRAIAQGAVAAVPAG